MTYILDKILVNFLAKPGHPTAMMASFVLESVWRDSAGTLSSRTTRTKLGFERRLLEPVLKLDFPFTSSQSFFP